MVPLLSTSAQTVFIAAASSDIGGEIAMRYREQGFRVAGTYRNRDHVGRLEAIDGIDLFYLDAEQPDSFHALAAEMRKRGTTWDIFISAIGQLSPIGKFFDVAHESWASSTILNGVSQLQLLHAVFPQRRNGVMTKVAFLVGGAISRGGQNYSAYSLGNLTLIKFCELLHEEYDNVHAVAVGTGWVATKIHTQTLSNSHGAGKVYEETVNFLDNKETGTSYDDIFECINWCFSQGRQVTGGRNISVVHDKWRNGGESLANELMEFPHLNKLRRSQA